MLRAVLLGGLLLCLATVVRAGELSQETPRPVAVAGPALIDVPVRASLRLPCEVIEVYDGDTLTVEIRLRAKVRLLNCWAPEIRRADPEEIERGLASRDHLSGLAAGERGVLEIPLDGQGIHSVGDLFSFERVLGNVYVGDPQINLGASQVQAGHATKDRQE